MQMMWKVLIIVVLGYAVIALAGIPSVLHLGQVLDTETGEPVVGVEVLGFPDEWPDDIPRKATFTSFSDSLGDYSVGLNRAGNVHFYRAGYDSLVLHWPDEFGGSDRGGGCDITLEPILLNPQSK
jgi:hypothetical protein